MSRIRVEIEQASGFTRFLCSGQSSPEGYRELVECVHATMADPSRGRKVLVDLTGVDGGLPEFDKFTLGEYVASRLAGLRIGTLMNPQTPLTRFGENTAVNRGATLLVSYQEGELYDWLAVPSGTGNGQAIPSEYG